MPTNARPRQEEKVTTDNNIHKPRIRFDNLVDRSAYIKAGPDKMAKVRASWDKDDTVKQR